MDRVAVFVDAGYVFAQGSFLLFGERRLRGQLQLDYDKALAALTTLASTLSGLPVLRIYWYDGTATGPTAEHQFLAYKPNVKVRLGFVNTAGQQKGVDSLIVTDMIDLARNRAMADALLLSGDEDLRVGVQQAQAFGVRVHLLGIKPSRGSQSTFLLQESDSTREWSEVEVGTFLSARLPLAPTNPVVPSPQGVDPILHAATQVSEQLASDELSNLVQAFAASVQVPRDYDRRLMFAGSTTLGVDQLSYEQKEQLRSAFRTACQERHKQMPPDAAP